MTANLDQVSNLKIKAYSEHPEVYAFAELLVSDFLSSKQRIRDKASYLRTARKLIASIWLREGDLFRFTTANSNFGKQRRQVWMSKKVLKLFKHLLSMTPTMIKLVQPGVPAAQSATGKGMNSVYCRSSEFRQKLTQLKPHHIIPNPDLPRIELKNKNGTRTAIDDEAAQSEWYRYTVQLLEDHDEVLRRSELKSEDGELLSPCTYHYIRKFNPDFSSGGRFYAPFENWPKKRRLAVTIGNEPVVSMDISQLHPMLLLRFTETLATEPDGMFTGDRGDAYNMPAYSHWPRAVHKKLINTLFNSNSVDAALRSIMTAHLQHDEDGEPVCVTYSGPAKRKGEKLFTEDKDGAKAYLAHFQQIHPYFENAICSGYGNKLQRMDSDLVLEVIRICNTLDCPVMPIHDEFVFPERWLPTMEIILHRAFQAIFKQQGSYGHLNVKISFPNGREEPRQILLSE